MYLLDTNIVSLFDPRRAGEAAQVIHWMREHDHLLFLSTITLTEIEAGILKLKRESKDARSRQLTALRDGLISLPISKTSYFRSMSRSRWPWRDSRRR
jgi:toxin FitB